MNTETPWADQVSTKAKMETIFKDLIDDRITHSRLSNTGTVARLCNQHRWANFSGRYAKALVILANTAQVGESLNYTTSEELCERAGVPTPQAPKKTTTAKPTSSRKQSTPGGLRIGAVDRMAECYQRVLDKKGIEAGPKHFCHMYEKMYKLYLAHPAARALAVMARAGAQKKDVEAFKTQAELIEARDPGNSTARRGSVLNGPRADVGRTTVKPTKIPHEIGLDVSQDCSLNLGKSILHWGPGTEILVSYKGNKVAEINISGPATIKITE